MSFTPRYKPYTYYLGSNGDLGDYLLTGIRDDTGIQKAFTGAATQGSADVKLGRGVFNVGAILNITAPGVYLGAGRGVTILLASQSIYVSGNDHWKGILTVTGQPGGLGGVVIRDLTIDCNNMAKTQAWAVQGGTALSGAFVDGVTFEDCEFINMAPDINDVASAHGQITSGRHSWGDYGDVNNVRFSHCKFGATIRVASQ